MSSYAGKICTICEEDKDTNHYRVNENPFTWSGEMLEGVNMSMAEITQKILERFNTFPKEGKKMPTKFTFYLLRKRAKEIAFEEVAQKLAKEIIAEDETKRNG